MKHLVIGAAVAATLALAGCGSKDAGAAGSPTSPTTAAALTHADFVTKANAICQAGNAKVDAAAKNFADPQNPTQAEIIDATKNVLVPTFSDELDQLRALTPPPEDAAKVTELESELDKAISAANADPVAALGGNAFAKANTLAGQLGLTVCAS